MRVEKNDGLLLMPVSSVFLILPNFPFQSKDYFYIRQTLDFLKAPTEHLLIKFSITSWIRRLDFKVSDRIHLFSLSAKNAVDGFFRVDEIGYDWLFIF